tara:strand:- start:57051 stop:58049 length:999 start_codon:yes stop_codon:yes gene_type:complete
MIFFRFLFFYSCIILAQDIQSLERIKSVGFGSCNRTDLDPKIWDTIADQSLDVWVWLGDIVYTDNERMDDLASKYAIQKSLPAYKKLMNEAKIFGVWDDHDFGTNDGGVKFKEKRVSRDLLFDFLDLPKNHPARSRSGAYQSYCFGKENQKVCLYLLDVRYFKEEYDIDPAPNQRYKKNNGNLLGEDQWKWLERELANNNARVNLFGGGIQLLSSDHPYEKWSNFPKAQQRFFNLLINHKIKNPIYLSGDRHFAEVSRCEIRKNYWLYDATSSGLTHSYENLKDEYNPYRISHLITSRNFGRIEWNWKKKEIAIQIYSITGKEEFKKIIPIL